MDVTEYFSREHLGPHVKDTGRYFAGVSDLGAWKVFDCFCFFVWNGAEAIEKCMGSDYCVTQPPPRSEIGS